MTATPKQKSTPTLPNTSATSTIARHKKSPTMTLNQHQKQQRYESPSKPTTSTKPSPCSSPTGATSATDIVKTINDSVQTASNAFAQAISAFQMIGQSLSILALPTSASSSSLPPSLPQSPVLLCVHLLLDDNHVFNCNNNTANDYNHDKKSKSDGH
eukprot:13686336-Ditylum_brightwellii.AAC.1